MTATSMPDRDAVRLRCVRALSGHRRRSVRDSLAALAASSFAALPPDQYGEGEAIAALEAEVAALLGKPACVFIVKGVAAQQAALRTWSERSGRRTVAIHRKRHIDLDEHAAYERLHGLHGLRLGADHAPYTAGDLEAAAENLAVACVELPLRRAGFCLPEWHELVAISAWCRAREVPVHFDGARLWEAAPYYGRPLAEIAGLADFVYVSFYKGLGGLGGAALAGPERFIAEARIWHARHCGPLMTAFPFVIGALEGLRHHLPRMGGYFEGDVVLLVSIDQQLLPEDSSCVQVCGDREGHDSYGQASASRRAGVQSGHQATLQPAHLRFRARDGRCLRLLRGRE